MITPKPGDGEEPFFITEEIEAEMIKAGYVFEPPAHLQKLPNRDARAIPPAGATMVEAAPMAPHRDSQALNFRE